MRRGDRGRGEMEDVDGKRCRIKRWNLVRAGERARTRNFKANGVLFIESKHTGTHRDTQPCIHCVHRIDFLFPGKEGQLWRYC